MAKSACPICKKELDELVLNERARCAACGAGIDQIIDQFEALLEVEREKTRDVHAEMAGMALMDAEAAVFAEGKVLIEQSTYDEMIRKMDNIEGGLERIDNGIDQFHEFLAFHMGADWYSRTVIKFNEWKEKQKEYKELLEKEISE